MRNQIPCISSGRQQQELIGSARLYIIYHGLGPRRRSRVGARVGGPNSTRATTGGGNATKVLSWDLLPLMHCLKGYNTTPLI